MGRKVNTEDFREAAELRRQSDQRASWFVCKEYSIRGGFIVSEHPLSTGGDMLDERNWRYYSPLEDTPDLFLKFTRMHGASDFETAALEWSHRYGLPSSDCLTSANHIDLDDGLERLSLNKFKQGVRKAHDVLAMYEASQTNATKKAERLVCSYYEEVSEYRPYLERDVGLSGSNSLARALILCAYIVEHEVQRLCAPAVGIKAIGRGWGTPVDIKIMSSWHIRGLLGAMYLQMYWLITSGENLSRCKHCGQTFSTAKTKQNGRKPRRRDFCNDACRQAHHREKKKRQKQ